MLFFFYFSIDIVVFFLAFKKAVIPAAGLSIATAVAAAARLTAGVASGVHGQPLSLSQNGSPRQCFGESLFIIGH